MIELYHNDMSVCAQKVRFALAEKKLCVGRTSSESSRRRSAEAGIFEAQSQRCGADAWLTMGTSSSSLRLSANTSTTPILSRRSLNRQMRWGVRGCGSGPSNSTKACTRRPAWSARDRLSLSEARHGREELEEFHKKMPDPVKREKSWENITKGVESRFFPEAIKRFDKLLADMEASLKESSWLAGK